MNHIINLLFYKYCKIYDMIFILIKLTHSEIFFAKGSQQLLQFQEVLHQEQVF